MAGARGESLLASQPKMQLLLMLAGVGELLSCWYHTCHGRLGVIWPARTAVAAWITICFGGLMSVSLAAIRSKDGLPPCRTLDRAVPVNFRDLLLSCTGGGLPVEPARPMDHYERVGREPDGGWRHAAAVARLRPAAPARGGGPGRAGGQQVGPISASRFRHVLAGVAEPRSWSG